MRNSVPFYPLQRVLAAAEPSQERPDTFLRLPLLMVFSPRLEESLVVFVRLVEDKMGGLEGEPAGSEVMEVTLEEAGLVWESCTCWLVTQWCPALCDPHQAPLSMRFPRHEYWSG